MELKLQGKSRDELKERGTGTYYILTLRGEEWEKIDEQPSRITVFRENSRIRMFPKVSTSVDFLRPSRRYHPVGVRGGRDVCKA